MSHKSMIIADSVADHGVRLVTYLLEYPMIIHWDLMTHRALSRNSESARVISTVKRVKMVKSDTFIPSPWRSDETQMKPGEPLPEERQNICNNVYMELFHNVCRTANILSDQGCHREQVNSLFIPFGHISVVVSGTDDGWANFFSLRCVGNPRQELKSLALDMYRQRNESVPVPLKPGEWHLPMVEPNEFPTWEDGIAASVARCGRTTVYGFDGKRKSIEDEYDRTYKYESDMHVSPFEHQATPHPDRNHRSANFRGWIQYRQTLKKSVHSEFPVID